MFFRNSIPFFIFALTSIPCPSLSAQAAQLNLRNSAQSPATIRVTTDVVLVPVLVMDRDDQFVSGLRKDDFQVFDDRVLQDIRYFVSEDVPVSTAIVFDTSGSMARKMALATMAVREFLKASNPEDEFSLIAFNDDARVLATFTDEHERIANWLPVLQPHGWTALLDGIELALTEMRNAQYPRRAIFIISDGGDNHSLHNATEIQRRAAEANVQIYSIAVSSPVESEEQSGASLLQSMAKVTGGRLFKLRDPNSLPETAKTIGTALRNQYVLGYSPSNRNDGKYHRIEVKVTQPKGSPKLVTSFRSTYVAPPE